MKTLLLISSLAVAGLLTSCQAPASSMPTSAVTCSKCGTVSFMAPSTAAGAGGKGYTTLKSASHMTCPDCENKLVAWVKNGSFTEHTCKTCGGAMKHCSSH